MTESRFPILPVPLNAKERSRIKSAAPTMLSTRTTPIGKNAENLGPFFERLTRAFEFEWAWEIFTGIARHDQMTGKFSPYLERVGRIVGQYFAVGQIEQIYGLLDECLREGSTHWTLQLAIVPVTLGFAKRPDSVLWIPILQRVAKAAKHEYLDYQLEIALQTIADSEWGTVPHANGPFLSGLITTLHERHRVEKWSHRVEQMQDAAEEHERRVDLIHQAIEAARKSDHPSAPMSEAVVALIKLNECSRVETLIREVLTFSATEFSGFVAKLDVLQLSKINHEEAIKSLGALYLKSLGKGALPEYQPSSPFTYLNLLTYLYLWLGCSSLRMGLFGWWLEITERSVQTFVQEGKLGTLAPRIMHLASMMSNQEMAHVPDDFWKSFADIMPTPDLQSVILSKLAVRSA